MTRIRRLICPGRYARDRVDEVVAIESSMPAEQALSAGLKLLRLGQYPDGSARVHAESGSLVDVDGYVYVVCSSSLLSDEQDQLADLKNQPSKFGLQSSADATAILGLVSSAPSGYEEVLQIHPKYRESRLSGSVMVGEVVNVSQADLRAKFSSIILKVDADSPLQAGYTYTVYAANHGSRYLANASSGDELQKITVTSTNYSANKNFFGFTASDQAVSATARGAPVVDANGSLVGMLIDSDHSRLVETGVDAVNDDDVEAMRTLQAPQITGVSVKHLSAALL